MNKKIKQIVWRDGYIVVEIDPGLLAKTLWTFPEYLENKPENLSEIDFFLMELAAYVLGTELFCANIIECFVSGSSEAVPPANGDYGYKLLAVQGLRVDTNDMAINDYEGEVAA